VTGVAAETLWFLRIILFQEADSISNNEAMVEFHQVETAQNTDSEYKTDGYLDLETDSNTESHSAQGIPIETNGKQNKGFTRPVKCAR
jgi:hypothetical protein